MCECFYCHREADIGSARSSLKCIQMSTHGENKVLILSYYCNFLYFLVVRIQRDNYLSVFFHLRKKNRFFKFTFFLVEKALFRDHSQSRLRTF